MALSCRSQRNKSVQTNKDLYKIDAEYYSYITAMGKGKGIVFRINIKNYNDSNFSVDSYYLNNKKIEFTTIKNNGITQIEANYLVNTEVINFNENNVNPTTKDIEDPIISEQKFYPSWVIINGKNGKIKLDIKNIKLKNKI
jgi:hypothetical protein